MFDQVFYGNTEWIEYTLFERTGFNRLVIRDNSGSTLGVLHFNMAAFLANLGKPHLLESTN